MIIKDSVIGSVEMSSNESVEFENCYFEEGYTMTEDEEVR